MGSEDVTLSFGSQHPHRAACNHLKLHGAPGESDTLFGHLTQQDTHAWNKNEI